MHVCNVYSPVLECMVPLLRSECRYLEKEVIPCDIYSALWNLPICSPVWKPIPPLVSSIGLNYFLFLSETRLWGALPWLTGALSWLEETISLCTNPMRKRADLLVWMPLSDAHEHNITCWPCGVSRDKRVEALRRLAGQAFNIQSPPSSQKCAFPLSALSF